MGQPLEMSSDEIKPMYKPRYKFVKGEWKPVKPTQEEARDMALLRSIELNRLFMEDSCGPPTRAIARFQQRSLLDSSIVTPRSVLGL